MPAKEKNRKQYEKLLKQYHVAHEIYITTKFTSKDFDKARENNQKAIEKLRKACQLNWDVQ